MISRRSFSKTVFFLGAIPSAAAVTERLRAQQTQVALRAADQNSQSQQNIAGNQEVENPENAAKENIQQNIQGMWDVSWERFFIPETRIFYDYLTSWEPGKYQQHLPTPDEVKRLFPNECGYGTGMEDGMIFAGTWMTAVLSRAECEKDPKILAELKRLAHEIFLGVELCATVHSDPGFLARAVLPEDGKSVYPNSSRDQYTHAVHGLWHYFRSPLCADDTKEKDAIANVLSLIADRMIRNVIPENDFDSLRLDGTRDKRTISKMWNVYAHEAARLPMIYAAAWDTCRKSSTESLRLKAEKYYSEYRKFAGPAAEQTLTLDADTLRKLVPTYALLQMQSSLELLWHLEQEPAIKAKLLQGLEMGFNLAQARLEKAERESNGLDMTFLFQDWRINGGGIPWATPIRRIWYSPRESGEAAMTQILCPTRDFPEESRELLERAIMRVDPNRVATSGIFYLVSAWWNLQRKNKQ